MLFDFSLAFGGHRYRVVFLPFPNPPCSVYSLSFSAGCGLLILFGVWEESIHIHLAEKMQFHAGGFQGVWRGSTAAAATPCHTLARGLHRQHTRLARRIVRYNTKTKHNAHTSQAWDCSRVKKKITDTRGLLCTDMEQRELCEACIVS